MSEQSIVETTRPDIDIHEDVERAFLGYPPLSHDRHRVDTAVEAGAVTLTGHLRTPQSKKNLLERIEAIDGVTSVGASALYDDELLQRQAGQATPLGVYANARYGTIILSGKQPADEAAVVAAVEGIEGVRGVVTNFS